MNDIDARVCNLERLKKVFKFDNINRLENRDLCEIMVNADVRLRYIESGSIGHIFEAVPSEDEFVDCSDDESNKKNQNKNKNIFAIKVSPYKKTEYLYKGCVDDVMSNSCDSSALMYPTSSDNSDDSDDDNNTIKSNDDCSNISLVSIHSRDPLNSCHKMAMDENNNIYFTDVNNDSNTVQVQFRMKQQLITMIVVQSARFHMK